MRIIRFSTHFSKRFKKLLRKNPHIQGKVQQVLEFLQQDPFTATLETHKLKGKLDGKYACTVSFDLRIVFVFEISLETEVAPILLLDIGTHDEVYP